MAQFAFLQDEETRAALTQLASDTAKVWAPSEVDLADLVVEEYLDQVQEADQLLFAAPERDLSLGIGEAELWLLVILPVLTGFVANLLAAFSAWSVHSLREKLADQPSPPQTTTGVLPPAQVRQMLEPQARLAGLSDMQIDQLAALLSASLMAILLAGHNGGSTL
jgi:hypothetical protein